jgi:hypothetical protein
MFNYDLVKHQQVPLNSNSEMEAAQLQGASLISSVGQQSGDAVIVVFPYLDADTFDFETQQGKHISIKENRWGIPSPDRPIQLASPLFLDDWLTSLSVQQTKASHQGALITTVLDPRDELLARMSPGDWIVCWMFDNKADGNALRTRLRNTTGTNNFKELNGFKSGLKFIGKLFSIRKNLSVNANGARTRRVKVMAFSFTELDSGVYFDPELAENKWRGTEYMVNISTYVTGKRSTIEQVGKTLGEFITVFLGRGLVGTPLAAASPMRPIRVPPVISAILGKTGGSLYIDILNTHIGIQQYSGKYMPDGLGPGLPGIAESIRYTPNRLTGYVNPVVSPFNNTPIWGLLQQFSNSIANEMFASLRMDNEGNISPTLTIRQIPFNTEEFIKSPVGALGKATAFRSLPRWVVDDSIITDYSLGKTDALRINFVRIIPVVMDFGQRATSIAARGNTTPTSDIVDYERNGLRAKVASINTMYGLQGIADTHIWTHNVTDREMGGHLKLSGSMALTGVQEPISVGDNLSYGNIIFHIEQIEHRIQIEPSSGLKSFSTLLALSNGVPATGPLFPEIDIRRGTVSQGEGFDSLQVVSYSGLPRTVRDTTHKDGTGGL